MNWGGEAREGTGGEGRNRSNVDKVLMSEVVQKITQRIFFMLPCSKTKHKLSVVTHTYPALGRQRHEFEANLVYILGSWTARST